MLTLMIQNAETETIAEKKCIIEKLKMGFTRNASS